MLERGTTPMSTDLREAAANIDCGVRRGRFERRALGAMEERDRMVQHAVTRAKAGDQDAIRYLYVRYADNVYGYVESIVRSPHEAEDVTQQLFTKLISIIKTYEPQGVPFAAWILRVARNLSVDHIRARRLVPCAEVRSANEQDHGTDGDRALALEQALRELPEDQREVIYLRHVIGLSPGEIAQRMGRSESSVHGLHHRGRGPLQDALRRREIAPATRS
jgi:RNA polymerase sigma-70 factor, ECF subfamily